MVRAHINISWCFIEDGIYQEVECEFVTGKGNGSENGAQLTPSVEDYLRTQNIPYREDPHGGMVIATLRCPLAECQADSGCQSEGQGEGRLEGQAEGQVEGQAEGQLGGQPPAEGQADAQLVPSNVGSDDGSDEAAAHEERAAQLEAHVDRVHEAPHEDDHQEWETYARQNYTRVKALPEVDLQCLTGGRSQQKQVWPAFIVEFGKGWVSCRDRVGGRELMRAKRSCSPRPATSCWTGGCD